MGEHTDFFKKKTVASVLLIFLLLGIFAQTDSADSSTDRIRQAEESLLIGSSSSDGSESTVSTSNNDINTAGPIIRMILVLVLVVVCIYVVVWLLKRSMSPGAENDLYLKKTAQITLSPGKTVQIVTLQDKAYVLGVSDTSITLISEITDKQLIDSMNLNANVSNGKRPADFASLLGSLTNSAKNTETFLKNRREKINKGDRQ